MIIKIIFTCPEAIVDGYLECLHFMNDEQDFKGLSESLENQVRYLCERFYLGVSNRLNDDLEDLYYTHELEQIGRDLYYTTQGHGVGFWEDDYPGSEEMNEWVEKFASNRDSEYVGDDGLLYSISGDCDIDKKAFLDEIF